MQDSVDQNEDFGLDSDSDEKSLEDFEHNNDLI